MADDPSEPPSSGGPECPVDATTQQWIETSMCWFAAEFGTRMLDRGIILPTAAFLREQDDLADPAQKIAAISSGVIKHMMLPPGTPDIEIELFDGAAEREEAARHGKRRTVGHFRMREGRPVIALDHSEPDPQILTAIAAHELCHVRLLGEERISRGRADGERLTDLMTVFAGFGIFTTNAAMTFARASRGWTILPAGQFDDRTLNAARNDGYHHLGYLSSPEFGYALSCYCWLRREPDPDWSGFLSPGPRTHMEHGLAYLASISSQGELPTHHVTGNPVRVGDTSIRVIYSTMPLPGPATITMPGNPSPQPASHPPA